MIILFEKDELLFLAALLQCVLLNDIADKPRVVLSYRYRLHNGWQLYILCNEGPLNGLSKKVRRNISMAPKVEMSACGGDG